MELPELAVSAGRLRPKGMWGEPADRRRAIAALRAAVDLGASLVEFAAPFGAAADLVREALEPYRGLMLAVRLTGPVDPAVLQSRLGVGFVDLVIAGAEHLDLAVRWRAEQLVGSVASLGPDRRRTADAVAVSWPAPPDLYTDGRPALLLGAPDAYAGRGAGVLPVPAPASAEEARRMFATGGPGTEGAGIEAGRSPTPPGEAPG